jgi:hypothetical protein
LYRSDELVGHCRLIAQGQIGRFEQARLLAEQARLLAEQVRDALRLLSRVEQLNVQTSGCQVLARQPAEAGGQFRERLADRAAAGQQTREPLAGDVGLTTGKRSHDVCHLTGLPVKRRGLALQAQVRLLQQLEPSEQTLPLAGALRAPPLGVA